MLDEPNSSRRFVALADPFPMWRGGVLHGARVAYETWGELDATCNNAVLLFTGMSPSAHAASSPGDPSDGWWERMLGPGRAIDTRRYFVICINSIGSCFGSTGPTSLDPETGTPYRLRFPSLALEDIARGGFDTMRALGIARLHAVIGPSLGGMVALAFAAQFAGAARHLVSISATAAASPFAIALRSIQREAIYSDPDFQNGDYDFTAPPRRGLRIARKLGTVTYRSAAEWQARFARQPSAVAPKPGERFAPEWSVQDYLEVQAERFVHIFDANSYLYLSSAMDRFDLAAHGEAFTHCGLESALIIGVESDLLCALPEQRALAHTLAAAGIPVRFAALSCIEGHDSFLIDIERFGDEIRAFLKT